MIETRIAKQLNRIAAAAAACNNTNIEFAIIVLFQFKIVVIAHTNCLPKFIFGVVRERERRENNTQITSSELCVFRCSLCMNVISAQV